MPFTYPNPQPPSNICAFGDGIPIAADITCAVYIRQRWANAWTLDDTLVCTSVSWAAAPGTPTATLEYRYGRVVERGATAETLRTKRTLGGYYVKLVITCPDGERLWWGFIDDSADEQRGVFQYKTPDGSGGFDLSYEAIGKQTFSCVGMIEALARDRINQTYFRATTGNATYGSNLAVALSPPFFNPTTETKNRYIATVDVPNFATGTGTTTRQAYPFHAYDIYSQTSVEGDRWSTRDIVEYLLAFASPRDYQNREKIPLGIYYPTDTSKNPLPTYDQPALDCEGLTLRDALNRLMSPQKSLGYWAWVDESTTPHKLTIEPYTLLEADLTVGSSTLKANARLIKVSNLNDPATGMSSQRNESAVANQIVCTGARRVAIVSLKMKNDTTGQITPAWPSTMSADFATYLGSTLDPTKLDDAQHCRDMYEQSRFRIMYRLFKLRPAWDWKTNDSGGTANIDTFRIDDGDFTKHFTTSNARYLPFPYRLKIMDALPMKKGVDYSTGDVKDDHRKSREPYLPIGSYGQKHGDFTANVLSGKFCNWSDRSDRDILYSNFEPNYRLNIRPVKDVLYGFHHDKDKRELGWAIEIDVDGAFQGVVTNSEPKFGTMAPNQPYLPLEQLTLTMAFEDDRRITKFWPTTAPSGVDSVRRRFFDFGDRFQLIELIDQTIVGVDPAANVLQKRDGRTFIRDDRDELDRLAQQIGKYYAVPRNIVRCNSRRVTATLWPGQLITKTNATEPDNPTNPHEVTCNCVITEITLSMPVGTPQSPPKPSFSFVTSRGELDPLSFIPPLPT